MSAIATPAPFLVGIAGGSGSGKTTFARALTETLGRHRVVILSQDAYYRDRSGLRPEERDTLDFDAPDAFDQELFLAHLAHLRNREPVCPPRYCFDTHCRVGVEEALRPREIVLVEGLLLFHAPDVRAALDLKIFLDAPGRIRLQRRITRDTAERGRTPESVIRQYTTTVSAAHARHVEPTRALADLVLLNASRLAPIVAVAAAAIRTRLARRREEEHGARQKLA